MNHHSSLEGFAVFFGFAVIMRVIACLKYPYCEVERIEIKSGTFSEFIDRLNFACQKLFEAKHEKYNDFFASLQSLYLIKQSLENFDAPVLNARMMKIEDIAEHLLYQKSQFKIKEKNEIDRIVQVILDVNVKLGLYGSFVGLSAIVEEVSNK